MIEPTFEQLRTPTINTPTDYVLSRNALLDLHWDSPLGSFHGLPGVNLNPDDPLEQTLGTFLSDGGFQSYHDFRAALKSEDQEQKMRARVIAKKLQQTFPHPKKLLEDNPDLLNWVPWEAVIAYGKKLDMSLDPTEGEAHIETVVQGRPYSQPLREIYAGRGYVPERTTIVLERQNANARLQGPQEAVANAIDAISERQQIGQFALGVKQMFNLLTSKEAEMRVLTKSAEGELLVQRAKRGYREQVYLKHGEPTDDDVRDFGDREQGSIVEASNLSLDETFQQDLISATTERFKYVPDAHIFINGTLINPQDDVRVIGRKGSIQQNGNVQITINGDTVRIEDDGKGMNKKTSFRMLLPGLGNKEFKVLSDEEIVQNVEQSGEVLFQKEEAPKIVFSRNREAVYSIAIPETRLNSSSQTICLELGRALKVSEGREGFEMDSQFVLGVNTLADKIILDESVEATQKVEILNSILLVLETLNGKEIADTTDASSRVAHDIKRHLREISGPLIETLVRQGKRVLPNLAQYAKIQNAEIFIDPYLFSGDSLVKTLRHEGYEQLGAAEGIHAKDSWKVFCAPVEHGADGNDRQGDFSSPDALHMLRVNQEQVLPVVIDEQNRIVFVDSTIWHQTMQEEDAEKQAVLVQALEGWMNAKVKTGYEISDPRSISIRGTREDAEKLIVPPFQPDTNEWGREWFVLRQGAPGPKVWMDQNYLYCAKRGGVVLVLDKTSRELVDTFDLPFDLTLSENGARSVFPTSNGMWTYGNRINAVVKHNGDHATEEVFHKNLQQVENRTRMSQEGILSFTMDVYNDDEIYCGSEVSVVDVVRQTEVKYQFDDDPMCPYVLHDGRIAVAYEDTVGLYDPSKSETIYSERGSIVNERTDHGWQQFFTVKGELYFLSVENHVEEIPPSWDTSGWDETDGITDDVNSADEYEKFLSEHPDDFFCVRVYKISENDEHISTEEILKKDYMNSAGFEVTVNQDTGYVVLCSAGKANIYEVDEKGLKELSPFEFSEESDDRIQDLLPFFDLLQPFIFEDLDEDAEPIKRIQMYLSVLPQQEQVRRLEALKQILANKKILEMYQQMYEEIEDDKRGYLHKLYAHNLFTLTELEISDITQETVWTTALQTDPIRLLTQPPEQRKMLENTLSFAGDLSQRQMVLDIADAFCVAGTAEQYSIVLAQLHKIMSKPTYRNVLLSAYRDNFMDGQKLRNAIAHPEMLDELDPLRSWITFLTHDGELLRTVEETEDRESYTDVLPQGTPIELIAYLRKMEGLQTLDEMRGYIEKEGGIKAIQDKINLTYYQDELRRAIHGQAVGAGVDKRELMQNALYATRRNYSPESAITLDFYYRSTANEYVEEIHDNGTGILDLPVFFVPGLSDKDPGEGLGFFGSGFNKVYGQLTNEGDYLEVETVTKDGNGFKKTFIKYTPVREGDTVVGMVLDHVKSQTLDSAETGTTIRLIKSVKERIPELESVIGKNTYITMGALATSPELNDKPVALRYKDHDGNSVEPRVKVQKLGEYPLDEYGAAIVFARAQQFKSAMTSSGLHMSHIESTHPDYLAHVPRSLRRFVLDSHISAVASPQIQVIKDRSRFADEQMYLSHIQNAFATEAIRQLAYSCLENPDFRLPGLIPEDMYSNPNYTTIYTSASSKRAQGISQKIESGHMLDASDIEWIEETESATRLFLVVASIEKEDAEGKKDSLIRRFQKVQSLAGNTVASQGIAEAFSIEEEDTEIAESASQNISLSLQISHEIRNSGEYIGDLNRELDAGILPIGVRHLSDISIPDIGMLTDFFRSIGFSNVYIVPANELHAKGAYDQGKRRIFLSDSLMVEGSNPASIRDRWETVIHETAHVFECREKGIELATLDRTDSSLDQSFTHQQDGPFGQYYRLGSYAATRLFTPQI